MQKILLKERVEIKVQLNNRLHNHNCPVTKKPTCKSRAHTAYKWFLSRFGKKLNFALLFVKNSMFVHYLGSNSRSNSGPIFDSTSSQIPIFWMIMMITSRVESSQSIRVFDHLWVIVE